MPSSPVTSQQSQDKPKKVVKKPEVAGGDIRSFFGGKPKNAAPAPSSSAKGTGAEPISIDDSDEEVKPAKAAPKPKATTSKHFASSSKQPVTVESSPEPTPKTKPAPKRKAIVSSDEDEPPAKRATPVKATPKKATPRSTPKSTAKATPVKTTPTRAAAKKAAPRLVVDSDSEEEVVKPQPKSRAKKAISPPSSDEESEELKEVVKKPVNRAPAKKPPSKDSAKPAAKAAPKAAPKATKPDSKDTTSDKKDDVADGEEKKPKFNYFAAKAARAAGPKAPGSKDIPDGKPGALAGLSFVFTGELESLGREDAIDLCKRYFGRIVGAPSGKTDYVVLGENAGPSKLAKIEKLKEDPKNHLQVIDEDQFLELIRTREGELDDKQKKALEKAEKQVLETAKELERREAEEEKLRKRKESAMNGTGMAVKKTAPASSQLWTTKYAPTNIKEICGNKSNVEKLINWLKDWEKNAKFGFKRPGKDGMGLYRAVLISGPPGIGKTTSAHIVAKASGYSPLELNASDSRSKKLLENATNVDNTSLDGFFQGKGMTSTTVTDIDLSKRTCLIMDEVDGMSAGDRGGVGAMNTLIKKTKIPLILICNDRTLPKMKPLWGTTFSMVYRRPGPNEIRSRIMSILYKEKMKIPANVVDELVKGVGSDIRQVLNMLSTYKLGKNEMDYDESKQLVKLSERNALMTPFTIIDKLCGPYSFSRTSTDTLNDKMDLYFMDFSFVPLFVQEHYLKTNPARLGQTDGPERALKNLELISAAADSISDGDLVDRMIHGGEQHWSLLPFHGVMSTVRPASYIYGANRSTGQGWGGPAFPQWLGQNSKMGKLNRELTDIQIRMRLRVSGSRDEIRQQYMPLLAGKIVRPLMDEGSEAIDGTIEVMDEYFLGKEDWDAFVELGVDSMRDELVLKSIPSATKAAFTRTYNKRDHPIAFHKGDMFAASKKKIVAEAAPDAEEVLEDEAVPDDDDEKEVDVNDVGKDKLIKAVKPKGKGKAKK